MGFEERLRLAEVILKELRGKPMSWTELEKTLLEHGGSHWKFIETMSWLTSYGYIIKNGSRGSRALYYPSNEKVRYEHDGVAIKL